MLYEKDMINNTYEIQRKIFCNNTGSMYLAYSVKLNKMFVVKEIYKSTESDSFSVKQELIADDHILRKLDHPNLPHIIDIIEYTDSVVLIMEYLQGKSLDIVLEESGPLPQETAIQWAKQICDTLRYLQEKTKRDYFGSIKLSNVFVKPDGNIAITEFFIVLNLCENSNLSDTTCLGMQGYSAPEQCASTGSLDTRTDIYCLGAILHHLVTGKSPFIPPFEMKPIRQINAALCPGLEQIIDKCTKRSPEDRYQSPSELLYALENKSCLGSPKSNIFTNLLHRVKALSPKKTQSANSIKSIRFSAIAPKTFLKGEYTIIEIIMYEDE